MKLFAHASALVAMIAGEVEGDNLILALKEASTALWSPMSIWETVAALRKSYAFTIADARADVELFGRGANLVLTPIGQPELALALDAYARYGRGTPAALNMGDCFAYGCARAHGARLLYKGDDFALTDIG